MEKSKTNPNLPPRFKTPMVTNNLDGEFETEKLKRQQNRVHISTNIMLQVDQAFQIYAISLGYLQS